MEWIPISALGVLALLILVWVSWWVKVGRFQYVVKSLGLGRPRPIRCVSRDGTWFDCEPSAQLDHYRSNIEYAVQEIISHLTADEIRAREPELRKKLNQEIRKIFEFQDFQGKVKIKQINCLTKLQPCPFEVGWQ